MLTCMLEASRKTYEDYKNLGIDGKIFTETFKMFPRFVREHKESFGEYGFDRDFWICRIIAMEEFCLTPLPLLPPYPTSSASLS